jgi:hypothetical protein
MPSMAQGSDADHRPDVADVIDLAWAQMSEYVARARRINRQDQKVIRDALCSAVADIHAAGVKL